MIQKRVFFYDQPGRSRSLDASTLNLILSRTASSEHTDRANGWTLICKYDFNDFGWWKNYYLTSLILNCVDWRFGEFLFTFLVFFVFNVRPSNSIRKDLWENNMKKKKQNINYEKSFKSEWIGGFIASTIFWIFLRSGRKKHWERATKNNPLGTWIKKIDFFMNRIIF